MRLEDQLAEAVKKGLQFAEKSGNFIISQAPDLIQEFYRWHIIKHALIVVVCSLVIFGLWKIFKAIGLEVIDESDEYGRIKMLGLWYYDHSGIAMAVFFIAGGIIAAGHVIYSLRCLLLMWVSPKLYIIEFLLNKC